MENKKIKLKDLNLTIFWDLGISLQTFSSIGTLNREIALYKELAKYLKTVTFITYGGKADYRFKKEILPIDLISVYWHPLLKSSLFTLPQLLATRSPQISATHVFKTNQIPGSEAVIRLKQLFRKKLIARCGYIYSQFLIKRGYPQALIKKAEDLERKTYNNAEKGIVTSDWQKEYLVTNINIPAGKIAVIPNYVQTDIFKPLAKDKKYDLVFVGRGAKQKNLPNLLKAVAQLNQNNRVTTLLLVGSCGKSSEIIDLIDSLKITNKVTIKGNLSHTELPSIINSAKIFILPSLFEGHPKALLEAMSCGVPCIGTNVEGIKEDIIHLNNGYLSKTDADHIAKSIQDLLERPELQQELGKNGRKYILKHYDISKIVSKELALLEEIVSL